MWLTVFCSVREKRCCGIVYLRMQSSLLSTFCRSGIPTFFITCVLIFLVDIVKAEKHHLITIIDFLHSARTNFLCNCDVMHIYDSALQCTYIRAASVCPDTSNSAKMTLRASKRTNPDEVSTAWMTRALFSGRSSSNIGTSGEVFHYCGTCSHSVQQLCLNMCHRLCSSWDHFSKIILHLIIMPCLFTCSKQYITQ